MEIAMMCQFLFVKVPKDINEDKTGLHSFSNLEDRLIHDWHVISSIIAPSLFSKERDRKPINII